MRLALATAALITALAPTLATADEAPRTDRTTATALERSVDEPRRFPFERREVAGFERSDRATSAPTPPVISGPFGAM